MAKRVYVRNINTSRLYLGPMTGDIITDFGDFKEMALGFVQAIYTGQTEYKGTFRLLVSGRCEAETYAQLPGSEQTIDPTCPSVGWNLCCIGWRFLRVEYFANGQANGNMEIIALGKKGG